MKGQKFSKSIILMIIVSILINQLYIDKICVKSINIRENI